jgi:hypothetical protein
LYAAAIEGATTVTDENPIIEEIRRTREQMLATHNGDLDLLVSELQRLSAERGQAGQTVAGPPEFPNAPQPMPAKKVG